MHIRAKVSVLEKGYSLVSATEGLLLKQSYSQFFFSVSPRLLLKM
ncbi:hypothetical protein BREVNS_0349 [Brevinematales bacterium NS]|nr:hypothetical protein BREVNS_0349 [Brevinematales bacterium NS]